MEIVDQSNDCQFSLQDVPVSLWDARVKPFAEKCADVGKKLGVEVVDLYKLFHEQPVSLDVNL